MTTYVQSIDDETNYKLLGLVKDVKKKLKEQNPLANMSKTQCVEDIITLVLSQNREELVASIIEIRKSKGMINRK